MNDSNYSVVLSVKSPLYQSRCFLSGRIVTKNDKKYKNVLTNKKRYSIIYELLIERHELLRGRTTGFLRNDKKIKK